MLDGNHSPELPAAPEPLRCLQEAASRKLFAKSACARYQHAHYIRQLQKGGSEVPEEIQTMWAKAVSTNSKTAKTALFQKWLQGGTDYAQSFGCNIHIARCKYYLQDL